MDEWSKMWYLYTMDYYSAIKKEQNISICDNTEDLGGIMLCEISRMEKDKYHVDFTYFFKIL